MYYILILSNPWKYKPEVAGSINVTPTDEANWHRIDCSDGSVIRYTHDFGTTIPGLAFRGVYNPTQDRIYLIPHGISDETTWYFLKSKFAQTGETTLAQLTGGGIFNHSI